MHYYLWLSDRGWNVSTNLSNDRRLSIPIGVGFFREMVLDYDVYVDKTLFIRDVILNKNKSLLLTHPRRWGKSLNLDMLKSFLEIEPEYCSVKYKPLLSWEVGVASLRTFDIFGLMHQHHAVANEFQAQPNYYCNSQLFREHGLAITTQFDHNNQSLVDQYQGKHPVISLTLKGLYGESLESIESNLKIILKNVFRKFRYLAESDKLTADERMDFKKYIDLNYDGITVQEGLYFLTQLLYKHHGQKVYILVDEYDKPINSLLEEHLGTKPKSDLAKLISDVTKLISETVCAQVGKDNVYLEKLVLTGIFDTTYKESGSGCNNIAVYGVADSGFGKHFGFSEDEVTSLVDQLKLPNSVQILDNIKDWYNGYSIPSSNSEYNRVYTPWAVMRYLDSAYNQNDFKPVNYWTISGASTILKRLITKETCQKSVFSNKLMEMAQNNTVVLEFNKNISLFNYDWFADIDNQGFFTYLLLNSGYLTTRDVGGSYYFSIPNAELLDEFSKLLSNQEGLCSDILSSLRKSSHLKIVSLIKSNDAVALDLELRQGYIDCQDYSMNFNFFHLAALYGSKDAFRVLLNSRCAKDIDFANDNANNLKAIDYALLLGRDDIVKVVREHYMDDLEILLTVPSWKDSLLCLTHYSSTAGAVTAGAIDFTKDLFLGQLSAVAKVIGFIGSSVFGTKLGEYLTHSCTGFQNYQAIDISEPSKFAKIDQFMKFILVNNNARVVLDDDCCSSEKALVSLDYSIFQNTFYSDELLHLTLCQSLTE